MAIMDRIATATDTTFSARVNMVLMKVCVDVANEDAATPNHANRIALAYRHFKGEVNGKAIAAACIANNGSFQAAIDGQPAQLGSNIPDGDIEFVISQLYNHFANAYAAD